MEGEDGVWLSIVEYSQTKGISISTLRRRIKSKTIKFKEIEGKYFVYTQSIPNKDDRLRLKYLNEEIEKIKIENRKLKEKIIDYEMLVNVYEKENVLN
jgi:hypothetical protein